LNQLSTEDERRERSEDEDLNQTLAAAQMDTDEYNYVNKNDSLDNHLLLYESSISENEYLSELKSESKYSSFDDNSNDSDILQEELYSDDSDEASYNFDFDDATEGKRVIYNIF
jgi:hypothetical protein